MEEVFHRKGEKSSKFLLFIVLPCVALISYLLGIKKRKYYYDHFIFSTEVVSFFILFGFLIFPLFLRLLAYMLHWLSIDLSGTEIITEGTIAILLFTIIALYTGFGARRFFAFKRIYSIIYALAFSFGLVYSLEIVYKFVLFNIAIRLV